MHIPPAGFRTLKRMSLEPTRPVATAAPPDRQAAPAAEGSVVSGIRRRLLFRDTVIFLSLTAFTAVLFSVTLVLFRSFAAHQQMLARRWSERGRAQLSEGHPDQAVASLRAALTYAPGERTYEMLLAQALGNAGHTEEAYTYFTGLWDRTPGDGLVNLYLARLSATKGDREEAINFYRASIFGTWPGDAVLRRQQIRLELAQYLIAQQQFAPAREELRVAGSNAGPNPELDRRISNLLSRAGDPRGALEYELKVLADEPHDGETAAVAARLSDQLGDTTQAQHLADRALRLLSAAKPQTPSMTATINDMRALRSELDRLEELAPAESLPSSERARRLLADAAIARQRLARCLSGTVVQSTPLTDLTAQWDAVQPTLNPRILSRNHDAQNDLQHLIDTTETRTSSTCGAPAGDDALLLRLARQHAQAGTQAASTGPSPTQP